MPKGERSIADLIRQSRRSKGLRMKELARSAGLSLESLVRIEEGWERPSAREIDRLARALGQDPTHWLRVAGHLHLSSQLPPLMPRDDLPYSPTLTPFVKEKPSAAAEEEKSSQDQRLRQALRRLRRLIIRVEPEGLARRLGLPRFIPRDPTGPANQRALVVSDQGARPHLRRGDIVAVEPDPDPASGSLVVARLPGEPYPLVRARLRLNGHLLYLATNPEWNWWYLRDDPEEPQVEVLGRVLSILYRRF